MKMSKPGQSGFPSHPQKNKESILSAQLLIVVVVVLVVVLAVGAPEFKPFKPFKLF